MGAIGNNLPKIGKTYAGRHKQGSQTTKPQLKKQKDFYCISDIQKTIWCSDFQKITRSVLLPNGHDGYGCRKADFK